ncbi:SAF domain-containing protein [Microbacterium keratanolyticum]
MTTIPRSRRRFWGDYRFLVGIALIVVSIAGVWLVVSSARQTSPALQATRTIVPGDVLSSDDFRVVDVALGAIAGEYLTPATLEPGVVAARTIREGELVPSSATGDADAMRTTSIVITIGVGVPEAVRTGSPVEVWAAPAKAEGRGFEAPRILLSQATVADVSTQDAMLSQEQASLELVIERSEVASVLEAISDGSALSIVPLGAGS